MVEFQTGWGWQPALYLFLGGLAGGAFIVAGLVKFFSKGNLKKVVAGGMGFALVCLVAGLLVLITDVSQPLRAMMMWQSFSNFGSWMTIGAWLLFIAALDFAIATVLNTDSLRAKVLSLGKRPSSDASPSSDSQQSPSSQRSSDPQPSPMTTLNNVCTAVGMVLALGVVVYTGILLASAPGISFWNSWLLPLLFTLSALDTGVAAMILVSFFTEKDEETERLRSILEKATLALIVCEIVALTFLIVTSSGVAAEASADALVAGWLMVPFWIFVIVIGLLIPFAIALISLTLRKNGLSKKVAIAGSCCILVGGCALRLVVVYAGAHIDMASMFLDALPY